MEMIYSTETSDYSELYGIITQKAALSIGTAAGTPDRTVYVLPGRVIGVITVKW
jgi:hypothetical protein